METQIQEPNLQQVPEQTGLMVPPSKDVQEYEHQVEAGHAIQGALIDRFVEKRDIDSRILTAGRTAISEVLSKPEFQSPLAERTKRADLVLSRRQASPNTQPQAVGHGRLRPQDLGNQR